MKTLNSFLVGQSPFSSYILSPSKPPSSGMTSTCVENPPAELPTTILPTILPTKQPKIQENESVVGPCAGVLQYEPVSGRPRNVVYGRCQWQCANSHLTSSQYSGDEGLSVGKKWRANVRNRLFVTVTILLQQRYFAPKTPGSFVDKFRQISLAKSFIGLFSIWSESSCPSNLPLQWR